MSYSNVQTISAGISLVDFLPPNTIVYRNTTNGNYYTFDMTSHTLSAISDGSSFSGEDLTSSNAPSAGRPFVLGSNIYAQTVTGAFRNVWRWDSGTSWTKVLSVDSSGLFGGSGTAILTVGNGVMILTVRSTSLNAAITDYIVKYTTNGTTWNNGSISVSTIPPFTPDSYNHRFISFGDTVRPALYIHITNRFASLESQYYLTVWTGTGWTEINSQTDPPATWFQNYLDTPSNSFRDILNWNTVSNYEDTNNPSGATSTPTGTSHNAIRSFNFVGADKKGFGYRNSGGSLYVCALTPAFAWETEELVTTGNVIVAAFRNSSYYPCVIVQNNANTTSQIWKGTTQYPDGSPEGPLTAAKLYWGVESIPNSKEIAL